MTAKSGRSRGDEEDETYDVVPPGGTDEDEDLEAELMLLALTAQDTGEPTQDVDLSALTSAEKHALLALWRDRLGMRGEEDDDQPNEHGRGGRQDDRGDGRE